MNNLINRVLFSYEFSDFIGHIGAILVPPRHHEKIFQSVINSICLTIDFVTPASPFWSG